ncbi:hypothetical protein ACLBOM_12495 [Escherichia coli]
MSMADEKFSEGIHLFTVINANWKIFLPPNYKESPRRIYMSRKDLANAIRALSMDAVQKPIASSSSTQWAWLICPKCCQTVCTKHDHPTNTSL